MVSEGVSASLDYYRETRDATSEAAFFQTYGNVFSLYLADKHEADLRAAEIAAEPRDLPFVKEALASIEEGGFAEALARVGALLARRGAPLPLARLALKQELTVEYRDLLPNVTPDQWRRIRGEQDIIVRYEPEKAIAALPKLLSQAGRSRAVGRAGPPAARGRAHAAFRADDRTARHDGKHRRDPRCHANQGTPRLARSKSEARPGSETTREQMMPRAETETRMERKHEKYQRLLDFCKTLPPTPTAVAHPCDESSLASAVEAAKMGLITPILVGPRARIEAVAKEKHLDITGFEIVDAAHSNESAAKAVALVREGRAEALMKGSLHTDELMGEVVKRDTGLRTARRVSHCFIMDVPTYAETLIVTDAAVNIAPSLADKVDIIQNAIDLAHALRFPEVRVAILSAMETVNPAVPSTVEAAALCKMADRRQITGAIVDGPLALDNAISLESVAIKKIDSPVAGRANVLVVPDLEAGNMLAKSLSFMAQADAAGIVLGARVPIILTSRADSVITRLASCAIAALVASTRRETAGKAVG